METIFIITVVIHYVMILGIVWSIMLPNKRIWPPAKKESWQFIVIWLLFCAGITGKALIILMDWNSWIIPNDIRLYVGIPVLFLGACFTAWSIKTLGAKNTVGEGAQFVVSGPYKYTRNPQYVGDIAIYLGIALISNSLYIAILQMLAIIVFLIAPFSEENWLEEQYQEQFSAYKAQTTRFI